MSRYKFLVLTKYPAYLSSWYSYSKQTAILLSLYVHRYLRSL